MDIYRDQSRLLKAIGHPVRLRIVDLLRVEAECVCHLSAALGRPQPYVSQQLAILRNAGVIVDERDGTNIYYRLANANVARQVTAACADSVGEAAGVARRALACCNCPKCTAARGNPERSGDLDHEGAKVSGGLDHEGAKVSGDLDHEGAKVSGDLDHEGAKPSEDAKRENAKHEDAPGCSGLEALADPRGPDPRSLETTPAAGRSAERGGRAFGLRRNEL